MLLASLLEPRWDRRGRPRGPGWSSRGPWDPDAGPRRSRCTPPAWSHRSAVRFALDSRRAVSQRTRRSHERSLCRLGPFL